MKSSVHILAVRVTRTSAHLSQEDGHDGWGRLVGSEAVVVAGGRDGDAEQVAMLIHHSEDGCYEEIEYDVLGWGGSWVEDLGA